MFLWTKISPGSPPKMVVSGTRESEQPSQRMVGCWPWLFLGISSGCFSCTEEAHSRFKARCLAKWFSVGKAWFSCRGWGVKGRAGWQRETCDQGLGELKEFRNRTFLLVTVFVSHDAWDTLPFPSLKDFAGWVDFLFVYGRWERCNGRPKK